MRKGNVFPFLFHALEDKQGDPVMGRGKIQQDVIENDGTTDVAMCDGMARNRWPWHEWLERRLFPVFL